MTYYKCGHKSDKVMLDNNEMSIMKWEEWAYSVGVFGSREFCWECYCHGGTAIHG